MMKKVSVFAFIILLVPCIAAQAMAQQLIWSGFVPGNGSSVGPNRLAAGANYMLEVSGWMYFGRWSQNGRPLHNDPCYEFNARNRPIPLPVLKNSLGVNTCGAYNPSHVYRSAPFRSNGQGVKFSVFDTDYRDNRGGFLAMVLQTSSGGGGQQGVNPRWIRLFNKVGRKDSSAFKANRNNNLRVDTKQWDRIPYRMTRPFKGRITIPKGARVYLSSKPNTRAAISVDNFILIAYRSTAGSGDFVLGHHEPVYANNRRLPKVGPQGFSLSLELTKHLPQGVAMDFWAYAMDYGGVGYVSDVYLIIQ
jgi:hypothetical protein